MANDPIDIATELNNVLAIILASTEIALATTDDPRVTFELREIANAVLRAASLTHRLATATSAGARCVDVSASCWNRQPPV